MLFIRPLALLFLACLSAAYTIPHSDAYKATKLHHTPSIKSQSPPLESQAKAKPNVERLEGQAQRHRTHVEVKREYDESLEYLETLFERDLDFEKSNAELVTRDSEMGAEVECRPQTYLRQRG
ncbi:hypothetical protein BCR34DRAFT_587852 [Clohesyomyces aquaticus]|uniref:Uncharacterized protein n=1 Tax=Clohesyomyces aquaticus TaxID=1231657 RepID=A0A1Y1ZMP2_9PLEO|nr:hypothetical protein BCR34DRAFT_587852 [Clohesyomyces aquaticus]